MAKVIGCCGLLGYGLLLSANPLEQTIAAIEQQIAGRIGVAVWDTDSNQQWQYHGDQRFPMMSTFKTLACANMLYDVSQGKLDPKQSSHINAEQLVEWSPITKSMVGQPLSVFDACEATLLTSDNTAANVVLQHIGGPAGLTEFLRSMGDAVTRLDRKEPELNEAQTGDPRDTTTPHAMVQTLQRVLLTDSVLKLADRQQLRSWMQQNRVSDQVLRAVLPESWLIADRTGAGANGSRGITALLWQEGRSPIIVAIYVTETELSLAERNHTMGAIGREIFKAFDVQ
ncbi:class A beta-lactamase [Marinicella meishanensis]|uniref:class A beta-lactamase n=1 Tax=Marinicella meishanensis TaxID=2873263 RepID=UPI003D66EA04